MAASKVKVIRVVAQVVGNGVEKLNKQFKQLNKTMKKSNSSLGNLKSIIAGFAAGMGIRALAQAADTFQLLSDRIKVFTGSADAAASVMMQLQGLADYSKTSIKSLATSYTRLALATQELGLSQDQILATTLALQQTFRISGSTIAEATAATIQLSQGLSSGQLRGQELRSVMEQNTLFAGMLAKELGIARGQLIKFAESGKITSDVVLRTLGKNFKKLNDMAAGLGVTFEQATTIAIDALRMKLHELNQSLNISGNFAKFAKVVTGNLEHIIITLVVAGAAWKTWALGVALHAHVINVALVQNMTTWAAWSTVATTAMTTVKAAMIKSVILAGLVALGYVVGELILNFDKWALRTVKAFKYIELGAKAFANVFNEYVVGNVSYGVDFLSNAFDSLEGGAISGLADELKANAKVVWNDLKTLGNYFFEWGLYLEKLMGKIGEALIAKLGLTKFFATVSMYLGKAKDKFFEFVEYIKKSWVGDIGRSLATTGAKIKAWFVEIKKQTDNETGKPKKLFDLTGTESEIAAINAKLTEMNKTTAKFSMTGISAGADAMKVIQINTGKAAGAFAKLNAELSKGFITIGEYSEAVNAMKQDELNKKFKAGKITIDEYYASLLKLPGATDEVTNKSNLAVGAIAGLDKAISGVGGTSKIVESSIVSLTDSIADGLAGEITAMATGAKFSWRSFAESFINDLSKMIIKLYIILPLLQAMRTYMGSPVNKGQESIDSGGGVIQDASTSSSGGLKATVANGGVFHGGNILPFAKGGVVNGPTLFPMKNGTGLMGEDGAEAVIPLSRGKDGKLGVAGGSTNVIVNVTNNSSAKVETEETTNSNGERQIEMLIVDKVSRAIGSGRLDKSMGQAYGLRRRGA